MIQQSDEEYEITIATNATALTIAGSDPSGGAGLQADLKTFQQMGCYGMSVVSLITVQNTQGVQRVEPLPTELVCAQIEAVLADITPRAIKTGALGSSEVIGAVADRLAETQIPTVIDPVLVSKHGHRLADDDAILAYREQLLPVADVITPNRYEAEAILGRKLETTQQCADAAAELRSLGPKCVLLKAGEIDEYRQHMIATDRDKVTGLAMEPIQSDHTHGAGCVLSAAITGFLALNHDGELDDKLFDQAFRFATANVHHSIQFSPELGNGVGPVETRVIQIR